MPTWLTGFFQNLYMYNILYYTMYSMFMFISLHGYNSLQIMLTLHSYMRAYIVTGLS